MSETPRRRFLLNSAALALIGWVFLRLLVVDPSDNAYLLLWVIGVALLATSAAAAGAFLAPGRLARRFLNALANSLRVIVEIAAVVLLVPAVALIAAQSYRTSEVFLAHVAGLVLAVLTAAAFRLGPRRQRRILGS